MTKRYFITAIGTGVGKTLVTCALIQQLRAKGRQVTACKPVISGWDAVDKENDVFQLLAALGMPDTKDAVHAVSPIRFREPLSPDMAARREGKQEATVSFLTEHVSARETSDYTFVEGIGGVCVPLNPKETTLDLIKRLGFPVILVSSNYLGALSHTITALKALESARLQVPHVLISECEQDGVSLEETKRSLAPFCRGNVAVLPRLKKTDAHQRHLWQAAPDLTYLVT